MNLDAQIIALKSAQFEKLQEVKALEAKNAVTASEVVKIAKQNGVLQCELSKAAQHCVAELAQMREKFQASQVKLKKTKGQVHNLKCKSTQAAVVKQRAIQRAKVQIACQGKHSVSPCQERCILK